MQRNTATFGVHPLLARECAKYHPLRKRAVSRSGFGQDHVSDRAQENKVRSADSSEDAPISGHKGVYRDFSVYCEFCSRSPFKANGNKLKL